LPCSIGFIQALESDESFFLEAFAATCFLGVSVVGDGFLISIAKRPSTSGAIAASSPLTP